MNDQPQESTDGVEPDPGAVETIHDQLKGWLEEDRARAEGINLRASWLLGFCGVVLGLGATQADEVFKTSRELGSFGHVFAAGTLALAFVAVAVAACFSLQALLLARRDQKEVAVDEDEVKEALKDEHLLAKKWWNQLRNAQVIQKQIPPLRARNKKSAASLWKAVLALLVGITLFVAYAGVFIENAIEDEACPTAEVRTLVADADGARRVTADAPEDSRIAAAVTVMPGIETPPRQVVVIKPPCPKTTTVP